MRKWLGAADDTGELRRYKADRKRRAQFLALVSQTRDELSHVYDGSATSEQKRAAKIAAIERLRMRYREMRDSRWRGYQGYDVWFNSPINNAKLAATSVYGDQVATFLRLFDLCSGDYPRFYALVRRIGALDKSDRAEALKAADSCD
ncbi:Aminopeptidase (fragment) [Mesorhizobium prunaredense]|uniref:Aminopeptidase n=1 Tax=Mesorhizobium prunaredense TaxID=1631249 RepID=A0A1R3VEX4_9HYPH